MNDGFHKLIEPRMDGLLIEGIRTEQVYQVVIHLFIVLGLLVPQDALKLFVPQVEPINNVDETHP